MPFPIVADSFGQWTSLANQAESSDTAEYFTALANARAEKALRMQEQEQQFQQVARAMALQQQQQQIDLEANRTAAALQQQRFQNNMALRNQAIENERNRRWYDIYSERNALQQARNEAQDAFNKGRLSVQTELGRERNAIARAKLDADLIAKRTPKAASATNIDKAVAYVYGGGDINEAQAAYGLNEDQRKILVQAGKDAFKDRQDVIRQAEKYAAELNTAADTWAKAKSSWGRDTRTNEQLQNYLAGKIAEITKATATRDRPQGLMEFIEVPQWNGTTILKGGHTFDSSFLEPFMKFAPLLEGEGQGEGEGTEGGGATPVTVPTAKAAPTAALPRYTYNSDGTRTINAPAVKTTQASQIQVTGTNVPASTNLPVSALLPARESQVLNIPTAESGRPATVSAVPPRAVPVTLPVEPGSFRQFFSFGNTTPTAPKVTLPVQQGSFGEAIGSGIQGAYEWMHPQYVQRDVTPVNPIQPLAEALEPVGSAIQKSYEWMHPVYVQGNITPVNPIASLAVAAEPVASAVQGSYEWMNPQYVERPVTPINPIEPLGAAVQSSYQWLHPPYAPSQVTPVRIENPLPGMLGTLPKWLFDQLSKL